MLGHSHQSVSKRKTKHVGPTVPQPFDITDTRLNCPLHPTRTKVIRPHDAIPATTFGKEERDMQSLPCTGPIAASESVLSRVAFQGGIGQQQFKFTNHCGGRGTDTIVDENTFDLKSTLPRSQYLRQQGSTPTLPGSNTSLINTSPLLSRLMTAPSALGSTSSSSLTNTLHGHPYKVNRFAVYGTDSGRSSSAAAVAAQKVVDGASATDLYLDTHPRASALPNDLVNYEALLNPEGYERRRQRQLRAAQESGIIRSPSRSITTPGNADISTFSTTSGTTTTTNSSTPLNSRASHKTAAAAEAYLLALQCNNARLGTVRDPAAAIEAQEVRTNRPTTYEALHGIKSTDLVGASRRNTSSRTVSEQLRSSTFAGRNPASGIWSSPVVSGSDRTRGSSPGAEGETSSGRLRHNVSSPGPAAYTLKSTFDEATKRREKSLLQCGERLPMALAKNGLGGLDTHTGAALHRKRKVQQNIDHFLFGMNEGLEENEDEMDNIREDVTEEARSNHSTRPPVPPKNSTNKSYSSEDPGPGSSAASPTRPTPKLSPLKASIITHNIQLRQQHERRDRITNATPDRQF